MIETTAELIRRIKSDRDLLLVPKEIARFARVDPKTVRNWIHGQFLHGFKIGPKLWRISVEQLQLDFPDLPDQFWIDAAIAKYSNIGTMDSVKISLQSRQHENRKFETIKKPSILSQLGLR